MKLFYVSMFAPILAALEVALTHTLPIGKVTETSLVFFSGDFNKAFTASLLAINMQKSIQLTKGVEA